MNNHDYTFLKAVSEAGLREYNVDDSLDKKLDRLNRILDEVQNELVEKNG